jgi:hypothetical protein
VALEIEPCCAVLLPLTERFSADVGKQTHKSCVGMFRFSALSGAHACSEMDQIAPQDSRTALKKWRLGVRSNRMARYVTQDVIRALQIIGATWKHGGQPYNYKCLISLPNASWGAGLIASNKGKLSAMAAGALS